MYNRIPILINNFDMFWKSLQKVKGIIPFELIAWVVMPDHIHIIINPYENDLSRLVRRIRLSFSANYRKSMNTKSGRVWQYRFWDHVIKNMDDMNRHIDYIHYNPVKHGAAGSPFEYPYSSFHDYFKRGYYSQDWGSSEELVFEGKFGE
jgi:putative transposase